jgi:hypothetical protein
MHKCWNPGRDYHHRLDRKSGILKILFKSKTRSFLSELPKLWTTSHCGISVADRGRPLTERGAWHLYTRTRPNGETSHLTSSAPCWLSTPRSSGLSGGGYPCLHRRSCRLLTVVRTDSFPFLLATIFGMNLRIPPEDHGFLLHYSRLGWWADPDPGLYLAKNRL